MRPLLLLPGLGLFAALLTPHNAAAQAYAVTDLGVLPGTQFSTTTGINNAGDIIGYSGDYLGGLPLGPSQAFLYRDGKLTAYRDCVRTRPQARKLALPRKSERRLTPLAAAERKPPRSLCHPERSAAQSSGPAVRPQGSSFFVGAQAYALEGKFSRSLFSPSGISLSLFGISMHGEKDPWGGPDDHHKLLLTGFTNFNATQSGRFCTRTTLSALWDFYREATQAAGTA